MKITLTIILVLIALFIILNWKKHCPKCRRMFAAKLIKQKVTSTKQKKEFGWDEKKGEDGEILVTYKNVKYSYQCKFCKHKWHTKATIDG